MRAGPWTGSRPAATSGCADHPERALPTCRSGRQHFLERALPTSRSGSTNFPERATGIEPAQSVWKTETLPLSYAREPLSQQQVQLNQRRRRVDQMQFAAPVAEPDQRATDGAARPTEASRPYSRAPVHLKLGPHRGVAQLGSALALGARGRGFESRHPDHQTALTTGGWRMPEPAPPRTFPTQRTGPQRTDPQGAHHTVKSTVENLGPTRVRLAVELPVLRASAEHRRRHQEVRRPAAHPGLPSRQGAGPRHRAARRPPALLEEAVNEALPRAYSEAIRESGVEAIGQPDIEVTNLDDGNVLAFTAEVDVKPEITLPEYNGIAVVVDDASLGRGPGRRAGGLPARALRQPQHRRARGRDRRLRHARPHRRDRRGRGRRRFRHGRLLRGRQR